MFAPFDVHSLPVAGSPLSHEHVSAMPGAARCKAHTATSTTSRRAIAVGVPPPLPAQLIQQRETSPKKRETTWYFTVLTLDKSGVQFIIYHTHTFQTEYTVLKPQPRRGVVQT